MTIQDRQKLLHRENYKRAIRAAANLSVLAARAFAIGKGKKIGKKEVQSIYIKAIRIAITEYRKAQTIKEGKT